MESGNSTGVQTSPLLRFQCLGFIICKAEATKTTPQKVKGKINTVTEGT
jgi:hypothetical protein